MFRVHPSRINVMRGLIPSFAGERDTSFAHYQNRTALITGLLYMRGG